MRHGRTDERFGGWVVTVTDPHDSCPECGGEIELTDSGCFDYDGQLAATWGYPERLSDIPDLTCMEHIGGDLGYYHVTCDHPAARFFYTYQRETCMGPLFLSDDDLDDDDLDDEVECAWEAFIRPRRYWNPATGYFDMDKPLTPAEEARQERMKALDAGQLELLP